jgi:predicted nucleic acid-binding protein
MRTVFADTFYWIALADPADQWHGNARSLGEALAPVLLVTTDEVLGEFLDFFSEFGPNVRLAAVERVRAILKHPGVKVIEQSRSSFLSGLRLYERRVDKQYSLTDCISMETMRRLRLREVLTRDHHFTQEGFAVLFLDASSSP